MAFERCFECIYDINLYIQIEFIFCRAIEINQLQIKERQEKLYQVLFYRLPILDALKRNFRYSYQVD